ncbi:hypothetical protein BXU08_14000 [Sphingomonas sp. LM7]|nr:hypothetical protein BXU08_14000 [Sphingomonas sp. LM7]
MEVIDTRTGRPASSAPPSFEGRDIGTPARDLSGPPPTPPASGARTSGAGIDSGTFVTKRWYDDKAPRIFRLSQTNRARLLSLRWGAAIAIALLVVVLFWFWPLVVFLVFTLAAGPKLRAQLRAASTNWLDGLDRS